MHEVMVLGFHLEFRHLTDARMQLVRFCCGLPAASSTHHMSVV